MNFSAHGVSVEKTSWWWPAVLGFLRINRRRQERFDVNFKDAQLAANQESVGGLDVSQRLRFGANGELFEYGTGRVVNDQQRSRRP